VTPRAPSDRGAALAMVLTMLAVLSTLAVVAAEAARVALRRAANQEHLTQARWYAMGAERYALLRAGALADAQGGAERIDQSVWQGRPTTFPLDDGVMTVVLWDGQNCFNLNSLVQDGEFGGMTVNALAQVQFARLLDIVGLPGADGGSLAAALTDWLDSDATPGPGGLEDLPGPGPLGGYRPANTALGDVSELAKVRGFTPDIIAKLVPHVCVRPGAGGVQLNPNTLLPDDDALLAAVIGPPLTRQSARELIERRPRGGWASLEDFFDAVPRLEEGLTSSSQNQFTLRSQTFVLLVSVRYRDAREMSAALISVAGSRQVVRRVFGVGLTEHAV
jgi:general secretion pathway protein K